MTRDRLYTVWHFKIGKDDIGDPENENLAPKEIGNYTTEAKALAAIERSRRREGFRDWPGGFRVLCDRLDETGWPDGVTDADAGMTYWSYRQSKEECVFPVWHYCAKFDEPLNYSEDKEDGQSPRCVGTFTTRELAEAAVESCRSKPGFRDWPDSFKIFQSPLDLDHCETGFVSSWEDDDE